MSAPHAPCGACCQCRAVAQLAEAPALIRALARIAEMPDTVALLGRDPSVGTAVTLAMPLATKLLALVHGPETAAAELLAGYEFFVEHASPEVIARIRSRATHLRGAANDNAKAPS